MLVPNLPKTSQRLGDRRDIKIPTNSHDQNFRPTSEEKLLLKDVKEKGSR